MKYSVGELSPDAVSGGTNDTRVVKGLPLGVNYLVRYYGVVLMVYLSGWIKLVNKPKHSLWIIDVFAGSVMPDYIGGFNTAAEYKGFDLSVLFTYVIGGNIYDNSGKCQFIRCFKKNWNFKKIFMTDGQNQVMWRDIPV